MKRNPSARAHRSLDAAVQYHHQYRAAIRKGDWKKALFAAADTLESATIARVYSLVDKDDDTAAHAGDYIHEAGEMFANLAKTR